MRTHGAAGVMSVRNIFEVPTTLERVVAAYFNNQVP